MRQITKDIQLNIDGNSENFRLTKPDAFSGVEILRLLLRLQDQWEGAEQRDGSNVGDSPFMFHIRVTKRARPLVPLLLCWILLHLCPGRN